MGQSWCFVESISYNISIFLSAGQVLLFNGSKSLWELDFYFYFALWGGMSRGLLSKHVWQPYKGLMNLSYGFIC